MPKQQTLKIAVELDTEQLARQLEALAGAVASFRPAEIRGEPEPSAIHAKRIHELETELEEHRILAGRDADRCRRLHRDDNLRIKALKDENERLHDVLARLIGERDALRDRTYGLVQCLEADPGCMRLVGQIPSLYEAYNRARFTTFPEPVPSTGEDQSEVCICGHERRIHPPSRDGVCMHNAFDHITKVCDCGGFEPVPDEGNETDGGRPVPLSGWPYDDGSRD